MARAYMAGWPLTISWSPTKVVRRQQLRSVVLPHQGHCAVWQTYSNYGDRRRSETVEQPSSGSATRWHCFDRMSKITNDIVFQQFKRLQKIQLCSVVEIAHRGVLWLYTEGVSHKKAWTVTYRSQLFTRVSSNLPKYTNFLVSIRRSDFEWTKGV